MNQTNNSTSEEEYMLGTRKKTMTSMMMMFLLAAASVVCSQQVVDNWKVSVGTDGKSATMIYSNPVTTLSIESEFEITVDGTGAATSGNIKFKNGYQRQMTSGEAAFYYSEYKGDIAFWDFRQGQGTVASITSSIDPIATNFVGQQVRAISKDGINYIGTLSLLSTSPDWFALNVKGSRILCYRYAIKEIQMLK
jgi:hypothetical protein